MAENIVSIGAYIQNGDVIDWTNTTDTAIAYHQVVPLATGIGIAQDVIEPGKTGGLVIAPHVFALATDETEVPVGTPLYFDPAAGKVTKMESAGAVIAGTSVGLPAGGMIPVKINTVFSGGSAGAAGTPGAKGDKGDKGDTGAAGVGVTAIALTKDTNGAITGGTWTGSDKKTNTITITTAGA